MEFTIENGKLYMLQTRNGKRTAAAALKVAVDLVDEGMIDEKEAVCRVDPKQLDALLHPTFDAEALKKAQVVGKGLAASPGAACGRVVFTAEEAKEWHERGEKVILVRLETSPEDIEGMQVSQGILTVRGGMTSHAAVVARGMGTCCVSGCGDIVVDYENKKFTLAGKEYHEGDWISLDGSTGNIYGEAVATVTKRRSCMVAAHWAYLRMLCRSRPWLERPTARRTRRIVHTLTREPNRLVARSPRSCESPVEMSERRPRTSRLWSRK